MKKISSVSEFEKFYNKYPIDAENVDLSQADWIVNPCLNGSNYHNSNLHIVIDSSLDSLYSIIDCDLRGNIISFVHTDCDSNECYYNRFNNGMQFRNVLFDDRQIEYLNSFIEKNFNLYTVDYQTLIQNKNLRISAANVIYIISHQIYNIDSLLNRTGIMLNDEIDEKVSVIEEFLDSCNCPCIKKIYNNIENQLTNREKVQMFVERMIVGKTFHDLVIDKEMYTALMNLHIIDCNFENVVFDVPTNFISNSPRSFQMHFTINNIEKPKFPNINFRDWKEVNIKRVGLKSPITFRRNLYLELGRTCNAKCSFCRNGCMEKEEYDFDRIIDELDDNIRLFDKVYIAGGEPTLKIRNIKLLEDKFYDYDDKFTIISNGTTNLKELYSDSYRLKYMISRHSYDEEENASIFGISANNFLSLYEINSQIKNPASLSCTCIRDGMDTVEKIIEYIQFAYGCGTTDIVFTNLHDDSSISLPYYNRKNLSLNIDNSVFEEVIKILKNNGLVETKYPIISSSGYELRTLKRKLGRTLNISFKRYVSKNELEILWVNAVKRTFDLSMSPNGTIYDTWSELNSKAITKKR